MLILAARLSNLSVGCPALQMKIKFPNWRVEFPDSKNQKLLWKKPFQAIQGDLKFIRYASAMSELPSLISSQYVLHFVKPARLANNDRRGPGKLACQCIRQLSWQWCLGERWQRNSERSQITSVKCAVEGSSGEDVYPTDSLVEKHENRRERKLIRPEGLQ